MNVTAFAHAYKQWNTPGLKKPDEYNRLHEALLQYPNPEHTINWEPSHGFIDQANCSCGWEGPGYWDGAEYAFIGWTKHVADAMGLLPRKCPCGKEYIPANGEKACHQLVATT